MERHLTAFPLLVSVQTSSRAPSLGRLQFLCLSASTPSKELSCPFKF